MTEQGDAAADAHQIHAHNGKLDESSSNNHRGEVAGAGGRITLSESEQLALTVSEWCAKWQQQDAYIGGIERRLSDQDVDVNDLRQSCERAKAQLAEAQQREKLLVRRLAAKEQEMQEYVCQVTELKTTQAPTTASLRSTLLDPAVNGLLQLLRAELQNTKAKLEETQNDLSAWKFTPDSNTGKRLMAKCRLLYQENEELGKMTSGGRIAILEGDLALQKKFSEEVRQSQLELDSFLADFDEDVEGMQSTIMFLQQELRRSKEALVQLQRENATLRAASASVGGGGEAAANNTRLYNNGGNGGGGGATTPSHRRANGDASDVVRDDHDDTDERTTRVKRMRRSSVLSIDYNDDDNLCNTNGDNAGGVSDADAELTQ